MPQPGQRAPPHGHNFDVRVCVQNVCPPQTGNGRVVRPSRCPVPGYAERHVSALQPGAAGRQRAGVPGPRRPVEIVADRLAHSVAGLVGHNAGAPQACPERSPRVVGVDETHRVVLPHGKMIHSLRHLADASLVFLCEW